MIAAIRVSQRHTNRRALRPTPTDFRPVATCSKSSRWVFVGFPALLQHITKNRKTSAPIASLFARVAAAFLLVLCSAFLPDNAVFFCCVTKTHNCCFGCFGCFGCCCCLLSLVFFLFSLFHRFFFLLFLIGSSFTLPTRSLATLFRSTSATSASLSYLFSHKQTFQDA